MLLPARLLPVLTALAAALLLIVARPAHAAPASMLGVQIDVVDDLKRIDAELADVQRAHGRAVRIEISWAALQPHGPGSFDESALKPIDHLIDGARKRGIKVLVFLDRTPCWASTSPEKGDCTGKNANRFDVTRYQPKDVNDYVPVATFVAQRYAGKLAAFEVWNEPDQRNEKYWAGPNKVENYVALMKAVYAPLKQAAPKVPIIAGSFVGVNGAWLKAMYAAGAKGYYDGLAVHFYDLPLYALKNTRQIQLANGDRKPLWLTEFGWTSCARRGGPKFRADHPCVTKAAQGRGLVDVLRAARQTPWIKSAIIYSLSDSSDDYQFGLLDSKDRRKPAFFAVRRALSKRRPGSVSKPSLRVRRKGHRLIASGHGSVADVYEIDVLQGSKLLYIATVRTSGSGAYSVKLPRQVGVSGLKIRAKSLWSGRGVTRRT